MRYFVAVSLFFLNVFAQVSFEDVDVVTSVPIKYQKQIKELIEIHSEVKYGVDVGSSSGNRARFVARLLSFGSKIYCIDPWELDVGAEAKSIFLSHMNYENLGDKLVPLQLKSLDALDHFQNLSLDFVFIDGSKEYLTVFYDVYFWFLKLKKDGILCGDDHDNAIVKFAIENAARLLKKDQDLRHDETFWWFEPKY